MQVNDKLSAAPPRRGGEPSERALASVDLAEEGGGFLEFASYYVCSYQRTTTPSLRSFPSFAGGEFRATPKVYDTLV